MPRLDPETGHGLVTDVCLKRKIRNYVELIKNSQPGFEIQVREKAIHNQQHARAHEDIKPAPAQVPAVEPEKKGLKSSSAANEAEAVDAARAWMCQNFYDVRTFGAVMSTGIDCGQVRGPVQLAFAHSLDPIVPREVTITRMAVTTEQEAAKQKGGNRTMGHKFIIPYALYRVHGFISAPLAEKTGFSGEDLDLLWQALQNMFEHDHSASRGEMALRNLLIFKHGDRLGHASAQKLFRLVKAVRTGDLDAPPRTFDDYQVTIERQSLPEGVELMELL
jgi:CRISPR-associated protein Csd2